MISIEVFARSLVAWIIAPTNRIRFGRSAGMQKKTSRPRLLRKSSSQFKLVVISDARRASIAQLLKQIKISISLSVSLRLIG